MFNGELKINNLTMLTMRVYEDATMGFRDQGEGGVRKQMLLPSQLG